MWSTVRLCLLFHDLKCAIGRAVVGQYDLQRLAGLREGAPHGFAHKAFLLVCNKKKTDKRFLLHVVPLNWFNVVPATLVL